jgi:pimeloyl-ACP methyl ester carboxylesterase
LLCALAAPTVLLGSASTTCSPHTMLATVLRLLRILLAQLAGLLLGVPLTLLALLRLASQKGPLVLCRGWRSSRAAVPACSQDSKWGQHRLVTANGLKLHIVEAGSASKPLLLLLHGFPECWWSWRFWLLALAKDYHVVAVDQRGYGDSERPGSCEAYAVRHLVADVLALVPALGHKEVTLCGHDWGALVAWSASGPLQAAGLLKGLIILNGPHPASYLAKAGLSQLLKSLYIIMFQVPVLAEFWLSRGDGALFGQMFLGRMMGVRRRTGALALSAADLDVFLHHISRPGALTAALSWYRQLPALTHEDFRALPPSAAQPLRCPVLVLWGSEDGALGTELLRGTERFAPQMTAVVLQGCSHWSQQDFAEEVLQEVGKFLRVQPDMAKLKSAVS